MLNEDKEDQLLEDYLKSEQFKLDMEKEINSKTWDVGLPKIIGRNGWVVELWPDGTEIKIKQYGK